MMRGVLHKIVLEVWLGTLAFAIGLFVIKALLTLILPQFQAELSELAMSIPFLRSMLSALLGAEVGEELTSSMIEGVLWAHPLVLSMPWAHEMLLCTRVPAGEVDRGTIDVLLGLPVSRRRLFLAESFVWLASGVFILAAGWVGDLAGRTMLAGVETANAWHGVLVALNLGCLYVAVGGFAFLVSALSSRRGVALGIVFAMVLASFLLVFIAEFWAPARSLVFLSLLDYYRPAQVLGAGRLPLGDVAVLLGLGVVMWTAAGVVFMRRDVRTI